MKIYLAGSMAAGRDFENNLKIISDSLEKMGHEVLTKSNVVLNTLDQGKHKTIEERRHIVARDIQWLKKCGVFIAEVSQYSHGVGYEERMAEELGKPILLLRDDSLNQQNYSAFLDGTSHSPFSFAFYNKRNINKVLNNFFEKIKGKLIVIEGADGSGKATQMGLLQKRLKKFKQKIMIADFPRYYDSKWGKLVGEFLAGKFGQLDEVDPHLSCLTYMLDEYTWSRDIGRPWVDKGGIILSNRYFTSNIHQIARIPVGKRKEFAEWIWHMGYEELGILKPKLVIFLDVPPLISQKLMLKKAKREYLKGKKKDIAETNIYHQTESYKEYLKKISEDKDWVRIPCSQNGKIDSIEEIHERVWEAVSAKLGI